MSDLDDICNAWANGESWNNSGPLNLSDEEVEKIYATIKKTIAEISDLPIKHKMYFMGQFIEQMMHHAEDCFEKSGEVFESWETDFSKQMDNYFNAQMIADEYYADKTRPGQLYDRLDDLN